MTPYTNTSKSHQQAWNSNPTSSATPIPSPLMKHMMKMQKKTMIENCSFALLINDILLKMNLNNRKNMSTMNCTSDINTDYCMNPIKMKKRNMPIQRWRCCFSGPFPWDHQDEGMISFNVRCCSPGAIHLQRPVGSLPKTRWFDCRTRRWLGCKTAGEIGSEEPQKLWDSLRNFWIVGVQGGNYMQDIFRFRGAFWVRIQLHCFCFQALCVSQPQNLGDGCMLVFIGMRIWNRSPLDNKKQMISETGFTIPQTYHVNDTIPQ